MGKYILNPETLLYEIKEVSLKSKVFKGVLLFAGSVAMAVLYLWLFTSSLVMTCLRLCSSRPSTPVGMPR